MNINKPIFLSDVGLTTTSANHIANLAKEYYQNVETELNNISLYATEVELLSAGKSVNINSGTSNEVFTLIPDKLLFISEAKSLIAWLREAIKAKEEYIYRFRNAAIHDYAEMHNEIVPVSPQKDKILSEKEYYESLTIKERNRYYYLETQVSVIGKYIHEKGKFAVARSEALKILRKPNKISGDGQDLTIYKFIPTFSVEQIDSMFFKLQKEHRQLQAELNSIKFKCEEALNTSARESARKYNLEHTEYINQYKQMAEKATLYFKTLEEDASKLKIVIPNELQKIYNIINNLSKEETEALA